MTKKTKVISHGSAWMSVTFLYMIKLCILEEQYVMLNKKHHIYTNTKKKKSKY